MGREAVSKKKKEETNLLRGEPIKPIYNGTKDAKCLRLSVHRLTKRRLGSYRAFSGEKKRKRSGCKRKGGRKVMQN